MGHLDGKVAIVTGAGRGIGRSHALALAAHGAKVVVNDIGLVNFDGDGGISDAPARQVVDEIVAAGGTAAPDFSDISTWSGAKDLIDGTVAGFGDIDIIVNNAGVGPFGSIETLKPADWDRTIAVNLTGTAAVLHHAAIYWRQQGPRPGRAIVNTTSSVGLSPVPGNPMYVASKAAVAALTISTAIELAGLGVKVNGLAPVARTRISEFVAHELMKPVASDTFDRMDPANTSAVVVYLASPSCGFTGRIFGIVGDDLSVFDGWTVGHHFNNGATPWTMEALELALADVPALQSVQQQTTDGVKQGTLPPATVLDDLAGAGVTTLRAAPAC